MAAPDTTIVAPEAEAPVVHKFYSKHSNFKLTRIPLNRLPDAFGVQQVIQQGVSYSFAPDGTYEAYDGQDLYPDGPVVMVDGKPERSVQDAVEYLRGHEWFNLKFFEEGNEPDAPKPSAEDFMTIVTAAAASLNPVELEELLVHERETNQRETLIKAGETALAQIQAVQAQIAEDKAAPEGE